MSHQGYIFTPVKCSGEVLDGAIVSLRRGDTDICIHPTGECCLVIFPWYADVADRRPALELVKAMGFQDVVETGQLAYEIPGVDTNDFDYVKVET